MLFAITLLEKAFKWFPMLKKMLRIEKLCAAIGFTKEMIEGLLTKKRLSDATAGFIPKNTGGSLISRMMFSRWKGIRAMIAGWVEKMIYNNYSF